MTQSKKTGDVITIDHGDYSVDLSSMISDGMTTISVDDIVTTAGYNGVSSSDTFTISSDSAIDTFSWDFGNKIDPDEVAKMCKEYPSLEKVWRNFKSVYDMVKQDYKGKKKAGELDDDIPF